MIHADNCASTGTTTMHLFGKNKDGANLQDETEIQEQLTIDLDMDTNIDDDEVDEMEQSNENASTQTMKFGGKNSYTSAPIPMPTDVQTIHEFFAQPNHQKVLLNGGRVDIGHMDDLDIADVDVNKWMENARAIGGDVPDVTKDRVVKVTPQGIKILTSEVIPLTVIGTKATSTGVGMPEFQAVLIEDDPRAVGPRPLVWLFNKMVYGGNPEDDTNPKYLKKQRRRDEKAMLRFWAERLPEEEEEESSSSFVFKAEAELILEFEFPKFLLRFFPIGMEKAEQICR
jgi:hypothetical protein